MQFAMPSLEQAKDRISDRLLDIDEVQGVSVQKNNVTVYVIHDSAKIRDTVAAALASVGSVSADRIDFIVSGEFTAF
jgi:hypothetical protein